jgi:hypothetical protein
MLYYRYRIVKMISDYERKITMTPNQFEILKNAVCSKKFVIKNHLQIATDKNDIAFLTAELDAVNQEIDAVFSRFNAANAGVIQLTREAWL